MWELWFLEQADVPKLRPSIAGVCPLCEALSERAAMTQPLVLSGGQNIAAVLH